MTEEEKPRNCPDCDAKPGQNHQPGCDVERCPFCGGQMISCFCGRPEEIDEKDLLPWTGVWPERLVCVLEKLNLKEVSDFNEILTSIYQYEHRKQKERQKKNRIENGNPP